MNPFRHLRKKLGLSQANLAAAIGVKQVTISNYEADTVLPSPSAAASLIKHAASRGVVVTFDELYSNSPLLKDLRSPREAQ